MKENYEFRFFQEQVSTTPVSKRARVSRCYIRAEIKFQLLQFKGVYFRLHISVYVYLHVICKNIICANIMSENVSRKIVQESYFFPRYRFNQNCRIFCFHNFQFIKIFLFTSVADCCNLETDSDSVLDQALRWRDPRSRSGSDLLKKYPGSVFYLIFTFHFFLLTQKSI